MNFQEKHMKSPGNFFKPMYIIILAIIAGIIYFFFKKDKLTEFSVYEAIAENQFGAMRDYGTDEETLFKSLEGLSKSDLRNVYKAFGLRNYESGGKGLSVFGFDIVGQSLDIFGWYSNELTKDEKKKMRSIWEKSELKLTF